MQQAKPCKKLEAARVQLVLRGFRAPEQFGPDTPLSELEYELQRLKEMNRRVTTSRFAEKIVQNVVGAVGSIANRPQRQSLRGRCACQLVKRNAGVASDPSVMNSLPPDLQQLLKCESLRQAAKNLKADQDCAVQ
jgi:hypothetical protein